MKNSAPLTEVIDSGARLVQRVGLGPLAVLILSGLPWRFGLAALASRVVEIAESATEYGPYWRDWARELTPLFIFAVWGRLVFTRACHLTQERTAVTWRNVIPKATTLLAVLYLALTFEILLFASAITLLGPAVLISIQGWILASQSAFTSASPLDPWRSLVRNLTRFSSIEGVDAVFMAAWGVALVNLAAFAQIALELLSAAPGFDPGPLRVLFGLDNPRLWFGLMVGAGAVVEPFRLAALNALFFSTHSRTSGADLRAKLQDLMREEAA